jgi:hypothetical protein
VSRPKKPPKSRSRLRDVEPKGFDTRQQALRHLDELFKKARLNEKPALIRAKPVRFGE